MKRKRKLQMVGVLFVLALALVTYAVVFAWGPTWFDSGWTYIKDGDQNNVVRIKNGAWWSVSGDNVKVDDADADWETLVPKWSLSNIWGPSCIVPWHFPWACSWDTWYSDQQLQGAGLMNASSWSLDHADYPEEDFGSVQCQQEGHGLNNFLHWHVNECVQNTPWAGWPTIEPTVTPTPPPGGCTVEYLCDSQANCGATETLDEYKCAADPVGWFKLTSEWSIEVDVPGYDKCMGPSGWINDGYEFTYNSGIPRITALTDPDCIFQPIEIKAKVE